MEHEQDLSKLIEIKYNQVHAHVVHIATRLVKDNTSVDSYNQMVEQLRELNNHLCSRNHIMSILSISRKLTELVTKINTLTDIINTEHRLYKLQEPENATATDAEPVINKATGETESTVFSEINDIIATIVEKST